MSRPGHRRGPKPALSRERIADAALAIGFSELTLTAVAERLGVSHPALYTYVSDRNDLVMAAIERLSESAPWPPQVGTWEEYLRSEAMFIWELFRQHPGIADALGETGQVPTRFQIHLVAAHRYVASLGFEPAKAFLSIDLVWDLAGDAARRGTDLEERSDRNELADAWSEPLGDDLGELMMSAMMADPATWFGYKLDVVLAGIGATLAPVEDVDE